MKTTIKINSFILLGLLFFSSACVPLPPLTGVSIYNTSGQTINVFSAYTDSEIVILENAKEVIEVGNLTFSISIPSMGITRYYKLKEDRFDTTGGLLHGAYISDGFFKFHYILFCNTFFGWNLHLYSPENNIIEVQEDKVHQETETSE